MSHIKQPTDFYTGNVYYKGRLFIRGSIKRRVELRTGNIYYRGTLFTFHQMLNQKSKIFIIGN